jgi:putative radical SAM enzyme (TIGR03279 family)
MSSGIRVTSVEKGSPSDEAGIIPGDVIEEVNGNPVGDSIDFMFHAAEDLVRAVVMRGGTRILAEFPGDEESGLEFEPMTLMSCGNRCVFCFVDQNPPGMRDAVYFKDEDYRLSFLQGAYVTLTGVRDSDIDRIIEQRLSPLYVSVHATDPAVRRKLLGLRRDDRLMEKIDRLAGGGIELHAQIVLCPGLNDGAVLERTIRDLAARYPDVGSVAVVPVGLTAHREGLYPLAPVDENIAREVIAAVDRLRAELAQEICEGFVCCSDELFIRAGLPIPAAEYYGEFPQIENGVGMARDFLDAFDRLEPDAEPRYPDGAVIVTGMSMSEYIGQCAEMLRERYGMRIRPVAVRNGFYGDSVTVSGLLTGGDIVAALGGAVTGAETVILPPNCLNGDGLFLDGLAPDDVAKALGARVVQGSYEPADTFLA